MSSYKLHFVDLCCMGPEDAYRYNIVRGLGSDAVT